MCQQGDIVWVWSLDPQGRNGKERPFVIVSNTADLGDDELFVGVSVSSTIPNPLPDEYVKLPWQHDRHPVTKLNRDSAAVCNWQVAFDKGDIINKRGRVPAARLLKIIEKIASIE